MAVGVGILAGKGILRAALMSCVNIQYHQCRARHAVRMARVVGERILHSASRG